MKLLYNKMLYEFSPASLEGYRSLFSKSIPFLLISSFFLLVLFCFPIQLLSQDLVPDEEELSPSTLLSQVEQVTKLKATAEIPIRFYSKPKIKEYIDRIVDAEYSEQLSRQEGVLLQLMGFCEKRINAKKIWKNILITNIGGVYNEKTKELYVLEDYRNIDMMNSMILTHELRHAIQDQHFNLGKLYGAYSDVSNYDDRKLALLSAIEGDAMFAVVKVNNFDPRVMSSSFNSDPLISFSPIGNTAQLYKAPGVVKYALSMPYIKGLHFVAAIFKKKKWKGVNKILQSPPVSSEQILHPEKYLKKEMPKPVNVQYKPDGYRIYHSGVIGEFLLNILLKPATEYIEKATGWGGDRFKIYIAEGRYFMLWKSIWDKEIFCSHFYTDFKIFIEKKYNVNFRKGNVKGNLFIAGNSDSGYFFLRRTGDRMLYVRSNDKNEMNKFIYGGNYD